MDKSFKILNRKIVGRKSWDDFVDKTDNAWLWHRFDIQDALATWKGRYDFSFAVSLGNSEDGILAVVPLHLLKRNFGYFFSLKIFDSLGSLAYRNNLAPKLKREIMEYINSYLINLLSNFQAMYINLSLSPMTPIFRGECCPRLNPLLELGCKNTLTQTWVIDLRLGKYALWQKMEGRARTEIRKAQKMGVTVRQANSISDLDIYYNLHCETYYRTGTRPHPKEYFAEIWSKFFANGLSFILLAEYKGGVIAAENFGIYKKAGFYWTGAANNQGLSLGANSLLQWSAMNLMIAKGLEWYEVGEAYPDVQKGKRKGLHDFKKSFGGSLYPFYKGRIMNKNKIYQFLSALNELRKEQ